MKIAMWSLIQACYKSQNNNFHEIPRNWDVKCVQHKTDKTYKAKEEIRAICLSKSGNLIKGVTM